MSLLDVSDENDMPKVIFSSFDSFIFYEPYLLGHHYHHKISCFDVQCYIPQYLSIFIYFKLLENETRQLFQVAKGRKTLAADDKNRTQGSLSLLRLLKSELKY